MIRAPHGIRSLALGLTLSLMGCGASSDAGDPSLESDTSALSTLTVRGHDLNQNEATWMRFVATDVVPHLQGTLDERLAAASHGAWWALKEGDWEKQTAAGYDLCHSSGRDLPLSALETCPSGQPWQVGMAGVQVPGHTVAELEALARELYPGRSIDALLESTATLAGHPAGSTVSRAIVASSGRLRESWLLRIPAVGFTLVAKDVVDQCIHDTKVWCFRTGPDAWDETRAFAPTRAAAFTSIADIRAILTRLVR